MCWRQFVFRALHGSRPDKPVGPGFFRNLTSRVESGGFQTLTKRVRPPLLEPTRPDPRDLTRSVNSPAIASFTRYQVCGSYVRTVGNRLGSGKK